MIDNVLVSGVEHSDSGLYLYLSLYIYVYEVKVLVTQSCPNLCDPMNCSLPDSSVHGILQQEHWSGLPFPPPGGLPDLGMELTSPTLQVNSLLSESPQGSI